MTCLKIANHQYSGILRRHKDRLSIRMSNNLPSNRAKASNSKTIDKWFKKVKVIYDEHDFHSKPFHIFNCDETGMTSDTGALKVVCRRETSNPKRLSNSNQKKMYTILVCSSAFGVFLPMHIMFRGVRLMSNWVKVDQLMQLMM